MHIHINIHHHNDGKDDKIFEAIHSLTNKIDHFMANTDEKVKLLSAKLDDLNAKADNQTLKITTLKTSFDGIVGDFGTLTDEITKLKDQVANGGTVTEADLDSLLAKADTLSGKLDASTTSVSDLATAASDLDAKTPAAEIPAPPVDQPGGDTGSGDTTGDGTTQQ